MTAKPIEEQKPLLSAGIIPVRFIAQRPHYLLLRVYNYWDFPKGVVEEGELPLAAALREVEEETTLVDLHFRWGTEYRQTAPYSYRQTKIARYYLAESSNGEVSLPVSEELGRPEHHEFRWLQYKEARLLLNERVKSILDWANDRVEKQSR